MTTPDNLTDEQRERLGRGLYLSVGGVAQLWDDAWKSRIDNRERWRSAALLAYLAGRDDERAKWRERVAGQGCICRTHAGHDLGVPCPVHPIDATGGE